MHNALENLKAVLCGPNGKCEIVGSQADRDAVDDALLELSKPIPMILHCPACGEQHVDEPEPTRNWTNPPHRSHLCLTCGHIWRPADVCTSGVATIQTKGKADNPAPERSIDMAFEAVRKQFVKLPRYSFHLHDGTDLRRVEDKLGNWVEFHAAHELFDPVAVDAARGVK
jgi:hypothetical protein